MLICKLSITVHYTLFGAGKQDQRICLSRESVVPRDAKHRVVQLSRDSDKSSGLAFKLHINFMYRAKYSRFCLVKFRVSESSPACQTCLIFPDYSHVHLREK